MNHTPNLGNIDFTRDRWGRPLISVPGEQKPIPYTRISSFGSVLENQFGLNKWKMRTMLRGALDRPDLRARAESRIDDDAFLDDIVEQLIEHGGGSRAANLGTAIHEVLSNVNQGILAPADVPTDFRPHVDAWLSALDAHGFTLVPELVETHLVNDEFRAAGSGDVFLRRPDGRIVACDIKTGKSIGKRPLAYMVQLYLYATAQRYNVTTGEREPLGPVDQSVAIIAHIPANAPACVFYEVDLPEARLSTILASQVKKSEKGATIRPAVVGAPDATVERPPSPSPIGGGAPVAARIEWLKERLAIIMRDHADMTQALIAAWPVGVPYLKAGGQTNEQCDQIAAMLDRFERDLNIPFGAPDPGAPKTGTRKSRDRDEDNLRATFPDAILVDDDAEADPRTIADIKARIEALAPEQRAWVDSISKQASDAKHPITLRVKRTVGRAERVRAVLACVDLAEDADVIGALLRTVTGHDQPIPQFGAMFGALTIDQATRLQRISRNIGTGAATLQWDGDTCVGVTGDIA